MKDAKAMWIESRMTIADDGPVPNSVSRRLAGMGSVQEAFDTIQIALQNGRLRRAQRLIASIAAVDPGHPDIRRHQHALELALKSRDKARAEYVAACEAQRDKDWDQVVQRLRAAHQLRPCDFYRGQLDRAESMLAAQASVADLHRQIALFVAQKKWGEAGAIVDRLALIRTDEEGLVRLRAFVAIGLDDQERRRALAQTNGDAGHDDPDSGGAGASTAPASRSRPHRSRANEQGPEQNQGTNPDPN